MKRKIALAGIGKIALHQHVPALAASHDWELAATVSRHGTVEGVEAHSDFARFLEARPDIGTVSLCQPPAPRFPLARAALLAGRNVMLEKPPGATLAECHALVALAEAQGVSLYATWHSREAAQVAAAKAWLADKRLKRLAVTWKENVRFWHPGQKWIWEPGGFGIFDTGINAFSILTEILPVPIHLKSAELAFPENCQTPIAATLDFGHPDGAEITADMDFLQEGDPTWTMEAETDGGQLLLTEGGSKLAIDGVDQAEGNDDELSMFGEYPRLYAHMAKLVAAGESDVDLRPLTLVADALLIGRRRIVAPFVE